MAQIEYRFLSASPRRPSATATYVPVGDPSLLRRTRTLLDQYPYIRGLALDWLDRYDAAAVDAADAFITGHRDGIDAERAGHDLSVYLCDWVVANDDAAQWVLWPAGTCYVELGGDWLDPYPHVVRCIADRQPTARRFIDKARELGAKG
jgi:hypothetical protein